MVFQLTGDWPDLPDVTVSQYEATGARRRLDSDIFRHQDLDYAQRLCGAGVEVEFHMYPNVPHSFELFAPQSSVAQQVQQDRIRFLRGLQVLKGYPDQRQ